MPKIRKLGSQRDVVEHGFDTLFKVQQQVKRLCGSTDIVNPVPCKIYTLRYLLSISKFLDPSQTVVEQGGR